MAAPTAIIVPRVPALKPDQAGHPRGLRNRLRTYAILISGMITKWLLLGETIVFGLMIMLAVPVWAIVPMLFGARPGSDPKAQARLALVLFSFPLTAAACLITGWLLDPASDWMWVCLGGPLLHFALIFAVRIRR